MSDLLASITVISVVNDEKPTAAGVQRFSTFLERQAVDFDFVLVANNVGSDVALHLKALVATVPDLTVVFLGEKVHDDLARLVGIEHAIGDYVLFCNLAADDPESLPALLAPVAEGYDLVIGDMQGIAATRRPPVSGLLFELYLRLYRHLAGVELNRQPTGLRILSRAAALFLTARPNAELMVRARSLGSGFPAKIISIPAGGRQAGVPHAWTQAIGMLLRVSAMPLRGASYTALLGGLLSVIYGIYVFTVYLLKPDVAAGWTTISLQVAGQMFLFSLAFLFLSEYIIQIHAANPARSRRYLVLRELRSPLTRRSTRLNVVDAEGRFRLGMPASLRKLPGKAENE